MEKKLKQLPVATPPRIPERPEAPYCPPPRDLRLFLRPAGVLLQESSSSFHDGGAGVTC